MKLLAWLRAVDSGKNVAKKGGKRPPNAPPPPKPKKHPPAPPPMSDDHYVGHLRYRVRQLEKQLRIAKGEAGLNGNLLRRCLLEAFKDTRHDHPEWRWPGQLDHSVAKRFIGKVATEAHNVAKRQLTMYECAEAVCVDASNENMKRLIRALRAVKKNGDLDFSEIQESRAPLTQVS